MTVNAKGINWPPLLVLVVLASIWAAIYLVAQVLK